MKVIEHLEKAIDPLFSFEIIPPKRGTNVQEITNIVKDLEPFNPPFIDVTSHPAEAYYEENESGDVKRYFRKKDRVPSVFVASSKIASRLKRSPTFYDVDLLDKKQKMLSLN